MDNICESCGLELITGKLLTPAGVMFYPLGEEKKFSPKRSEVLCDACPKCGKIFDLRLVSPNKIVDGE